MDRNTRERYFSVLSNKPNVGIRFPEPKPQTPAQTFTVGDTVIVNTTCEDVVLHELTGTVTHVSENTRSVYVALDCDAGTLPFRPEELGHHY